MLFENKDLYNPKYEFHLHIRNDEIYTYMDLCQNLSNLTEKLLEPLSEKECIYLHVKDRYGNPIRLKWKEECKDKVFDRTTTDIYNLIVGKKEFRNQLETLNIIEPKDKTSCNFGYYCQFLYFFYILNTFVFPNVKYLDLFKEKNWSSENTLEANTGNEIYEDFILKNLYEDSHIESIFNERIDNYDQSWSHCIDAFFDYYNDEYSKLFHDYSKSISEHFQRIMKDKLDRMCCSSLEECKESVFERTVLDDFLDFECSYSSQAVNKDFFENIQSMDYLSLLDLYKHIERIPNSFGEYVVSKENIKDIIQDENIICICMNTDHITNTIRKKYNDYHVEDVIHRIWDFEQEQLIQFPDSIGFTFIEKVNDEYVMNLISIVLIIMVRIYIPYQLKYTSKRVDLENRSDASKKKEHSIKESYKVMDSNVLHPKDSTVRDAMFRIVCILEYSMLINDNPNVFLYFEVPMNSLVFSIMDSVHTLQTTEQKTIFFQKMIEKMS